MTTSRYPAIYVMCEQCHERDGIPYAELGLWANFRIGGASVEYGRQYVACPHAPITLPRLPPTEGRPDS